MSSESIPFIPRALVLFLLVYVFVMIPIDMKYNDPYLMTASAYLVITALIIAVFLSGLISIVFAAIHLITNNEEEEEENE